MDVVVEARDYAFDEDVGGPNTFLTPGRVTSGEERSFMSGPSRRRMIAMNGSQSTLDSKAELSIGRLSTESASENEHDAQKHTAGHSRPEVEDDFRDFIQSSRRLEVHLTSFTHRVQKLGSALGLSMASSDVHMGLKQVREYLERHAQTLGVLLGKVKASKSLKQAKRKRKLGRRQTESQHGGSLAGSYSNELSDALDNLSLALERFEIAVADFEDYYDQDANTTLREFQIEIRILSESLSYFGSDGDSPELRRYITNKATAMREHLEKMGGSLERFIDIGIPCISYAQKRSTSMLLNATTVATFFAGVAATTLQYSVVPINNPPRPIDVAVNALWFSSLVLSIGSAITGMLAMTWRQAVFSKPKQRLPWYIRFWIRQGYLVLLIASVIAFLAGLVAYVKDTQNVAAFWIVVGFTAFCVIGLANVTVYFGKERWNFSRIRKAQNPTRYLYPQDISASWYYWIRYQLIDQMRSKRFALFSASGSVSEAKHRRNRTSPERPETMLEKVKYSIGLFTPFNWTERHKRHATVDSEAQIAGDPNRLERLHKKQKHNYGRSGRSQSDSLLRPSARNTLENDPVFVARYIKQIEKLDLSLAVKNDAMRVKDLQFSPSGKWLVVCYRLDCCVYDVERSFIYHQNLRHLRKKAKQVEWSPTQEWLLTRVKDAVKLWTVNEDEDFLCLKVFKLDEWLDDIQWFNDNEFLALADDASSIFRINVDSGEIVGNRLPSNLTVHEMYSMVGSELVLIVATKEIEGLPEDRAIDCIIVYKMDSELRRQESRSTTSSSDTIVWKLGSIKKKIPLLRDVESLTFGYDQSRLLVSYEEKPPEIWSIDKVTGDITREHELDIPFYSAVNDPDASWGSAYFVGPSENIIACAEDGIMHFWHLDTREHFHHFSILGEDDEVEELPVLSFNPRSKAPMMASGGKGLTLKIWTPMNRNDLDDEKEKGIETTILAQPMSEAPIDFSSSPFSITEVVTQSPPMTPDLRHRRPTSPINSPTTPTLKFDPA